jgi:hypothetical protein
MQKYHQLHYYKYQRLRACQGIHCVCILTSFNHKWPLLCAVSSTLNNMLHVTVAKNTTEKYVYVTPFYGDKYLKSYMSQGICHITFSTPFLTRNRIMECLCANFIPFCIIGISVPIRHLYIYIHVYEYILWHVGVWTLGLRNSEYDSQVTSPVATQPAR